MFTNRLRPHLRPLNGEHLRVYFRGVRCCEVMPVFVVVVVVVVDDDVIVFCLFVVFRRFN